MFLARIARVWVCAPGAPGPNPTQACFQAHQCFLFQIQKRLDNPAAQTWASESDVRCSYGEKKPDAHVCQTPQAPPCLAAASIHPLRTQVWPGHCLVLCDLQTGV